MLSVAKGDGPSIIIVNTMIRSISKIDDYKMVSFTCSSVGSGTLRREDCQSGH